MVLVSSLRSRHAPPSAAALNGIASGVLGGHASDMFRSTLHTPLVYWLNGRPGPLRMPEYAIPIFFVSTPVLLALIRAYALSTAWSIGRNTPLQAA